MQNRKEIVQIKLRDGDTAYVEMQKKDDFCERGASSKVYEAVNDHIKVAADMVEEMKKMSTVPSSIELEFSIGLKMVSSGLLSWIALESSADAGIKVKMKWEKER